MILKFKNNNEWSYLEAETVACKRKIIDEYPCEPEKDGFKITLERIRKEVSGLDVNEYIEHCSENIFVYLILAGTNKAIITNQETYLLNDNGKTIERLV